MIVFFKENRLKIVKLNENEDMTSPGAGEIFSERHLEGSRLSSAMRGEREGEEMRKSRDREEKASGSRADPESERPREHTAEMADFYRKEKLREGKQSPGPGLRGLVGGKRSQKS